MNVVHRNFMTVLALSILLVAPACNRTGENKDVKEMAQKAEELEKLNQQASAKRAEETRKLAEAGINDVAPNVESLQLTDAQKQALETRIKEEKNSSYQALLQEVLDSDKEIKALNRKIAQLRAVLPRPEIARADDSHYGMAMRFLRNRGVPEAKARLLISKVMILDKLKPGFEVYHFYSNGVYGTWVAQGKADLSPTQLQAEDRARIEGERDAADQKAQELQSQVASLTEEARKITADIDAMRTEKAKLTRDLAELTAANVAQQTLLNSVHYMVGARKSLEREGVIVVPIFARNRAGANWKDQDFTQSATCAPRTASPSPPPRPA